MTTDYHLKSFGFHTKHQNTQESNASVHTPPSSFLCTLKVSLKIHDPVWDFVDGVTPLSFTMTSEAVLSLSCGVLGNSCRESQRHFTAWTRKGHLWDVALAWITSVFIFSSSNNHTHILATNEFPFLPLPMVIKQHFRIIHFLKTLCSMFRGHKDSALRTKAFLNQQYLVKTNDPCGMKIKFYFLCFFFLIKLRLKCSIKLSLLMYIILRLINTPGKLNSPWIELTPAI